MKKINNKIYCKKIILQLVFDLFKHYSKLPRKKNMYRIFTRKLKMIIKNYAEFTDKVPHNADFMTKRLQKRCLSWKSWRNYFYSPDNKIDFRFSKQGKYIVLYPVCSGRNSMRGEFFLEFEPSGDGNCLIHVTVKAPSFVYFFFFIWFSGVGLFTITFLCSRIWHAAAIGALMIIFGIFLRGPLLPMHP